VQDPWGNQWWLATHIEDVSAAELENESANTVSKPTLLRLTERRCMRDPIDGTDVVHGLPEPVGPAVLSGRHHVSNRQAVPGA
jgi:hypothetical protein